MHILGSRRPFLLTDNYKNIILADKPIQYYPLDEAGGGVAYDIITQNASVISGNVQQGVAGPWPGSLGAFFNGGYIEIPLLTTSITNVTLEILVNLYGNSSTHGGFIKLGNTYGYGVGVGSNTTSGNSGYWDLAGNYLTGLFEVIRWIMSPNSTTIPVSGWHHVVFALDGSSNPWFYLDGVQLGDTTGSNPDAPDSAAWIGTDDANANRNPVCGMAHAAIYNYFLSPDRIKAHYLAVSSGYRSPAIY